MKKVLKKINLSSKIDRRLLRGVYLPHKMTIFSDSDDHKKLE